MRLHYFTAATTAIALCAALTAQSPLTTTFASNNGLSSSGSAVFFDLTASSSGVQVDAFDLNFTAAAGAAVGVDVYVRSGTHAGFESSPAGWNFISSDTGGILAAGRDVPTNLPLATPFCVPAGTTIGIALVGVGTGHAYTNGSGTPCTNCSYSNAELTFDGGSSSSSPFSGNPITPRIANVSIYYTVSAGCSLRLPPGIVGVAEATVGAGTLTIADSKFRDNEFLRWNFTDPTGYNAGFFSAVIANIGIGGAPPIGNTPQIPGFDQLWAGSNPSGVAEIFPPHQVGNPDFSVQVPPGLFSPDDTVRIQGLVLDAAVGGQFPVTPTSNTILFTHTDCNFAEGFEGVTSGVGNYPTNWSNGGGTSEWRVNSGTTSSANTGPTAAFGGSNYMYAETSGSAGQIYIMNTDTYATAGLSANTLEFALSRVGATIGTLVVRMDDGTGAFATVLATYTGPEPAGLEWTTESIPLPTPVPANVQFQFDYVRGTSFTGDLAIDEFCLR